MASPRELVEQRRDAIPGRAKVVVRVLRCQGIKCPYTGAGARGTCVRVPSSEADPARGGAQPSSEADFTRGSGLSPRARRTPPEGALRPRARRTSPKGASNPRARRTSLEGRPAVPPWRAAGTTRGVVVSCTCFRCVS
jgi:hypothetical protein